MSGVFHLASLILLALAVAGGPAFAAGGDDGPPKNPDFAKAQKLVKAGDYAAAIPLLEKTLSAEPKNADALNYLGYSHRKLGDRENALAHYRKALALEPKHRGANEYLGELYLEMGELAKAEERLEVLDRACWLGCDEYSDLKQAINAYKAESGG